MYENNMYGMCGCSYVNPYRADCYYHYEEHQMGATIDCCFKKGKCLGDCPCEGCDSYISKAEVSKIIAEYHRKRQTESDPEKDLK